MSTCALFIASAVTCVVCCAGCDLCDGDDAINETVTLREQADVDDFPAGKCLVGDLIVGFGDGSTASTISNIDALGDLEIIEGTLNIVNNSALSTVSLPSLTFIGRRLLDPDPNSEQVRGGLFIEFNSGLTGIDLPELTDVGGCIQIDNNAALDPAIVDGLFGDVKAHAFPGTCDGGIKQNENNTGRRSR